jgi:Uma2 family endonuclease
MVAQPSPPLMTVDEYLELERHSDVKHEYIDGYVYAMAGGTSAQSVISANIIALLRPAPEAPRGGYARPEGRDRAVRAFRPGSSAARPCRVHTSDMRVRLSATRYVYPDVSVSCDERDRVNSEQDEIHYPRLVVEALSRTTQDYDRTDGRYFVAGSNPHPGSSARRRLPGRGDPGTSGGCAVGTVRGIL